MTLNGKRRRAHAFAPLLGMLVAVAALALPASALGAPVGEATPTHIPEEVSAGTYAKYTLVPLNTGDSETTAAGTMKFSVPNGMEITKVDNEILFGFFDFWACTIAGDAKSATCAGPEFFGEPLPVGASEEMCVGFFGATCRIFVVAKVDEGVEPSVLVPTVETCGYGAASCVVNSDPTQVVPGGFRITEFDGKVLKENGEPATQAGSHPHTAGTNYKLNVVGEADFDVTGKSEAIGSYPLPYGAQKDVIVDLPPGLIGNVNVVPTCTSGQLGEGESGNCPDDAQLGLVKVTFVFSDIGPTWIYAPVYNVERPPGVAGHFGFTVLGVTAHLIASVRTGDDYGVTITVKDTPTAFPLGEIDFAFWGSPASPAFDGIRGTCVDIKTGEPPLVNPQSCPSAQETKPFVTLPTSCLGPQQTDITVVSWDRGTATGSFLSHDNGSPVPNPIGNDGCNAVPFAPTIEARPTTNVADAPSGLNVDLEIPQGAEDPEGVASAHLKDTTVTLPEGLVVNPSGANGLTSCSEAEFGYTETGEDGVIHTTQDPATCPDASTLGSVEVESALVDHPLKGSVHIADPYQNPFNSLLALYITLHDPQTGIVVKLAGEVSADPQTGQLTTTFDHNPQLPFEHFRLKFFGGALGSLRTPALCGSYATTSSMTPWTWPEGETKSPEDPWQISQGANGGACAGSDGAKPHSPDLDAGTVSPIAGAYSPMVINLRREDGTQEFSTVTITPPPGLIGKLAGIPACPDSALAAATGKSGQEEKANPSCPAPSRVGTVNVAAGAGPAPYWTEGTAYLTGPYKGAPIGLAIVTPATAGPFDLGTVVVRTALHVNPVTAQITADADPIPQILEGIPLDVRQALIRLDRSEFTRNGTSCDPLAFAGQLVSTLGTVARLAERFQLGECTGLGLRPKMTLRLSGATKRRGHPSLTATLEPRSGDANLAAISVALPSTQLLDQSNIGTVCTRVQFAADQCPAGSIYGHATVTTPLLDYPLTGNVYLRSSANKLPDLVPDLRGPAHQPIRLESAGRTDTVKGALRNTFEAIPDAPFTRLVLTLPGGRNGLIQNSVNICRKRLRATVKYTAHNGLRLQQRPRVRAKCRKQRKRKRARRGSPSQRVHELRVVR